MAGTTALGLLAIKNNIAAFMHLLALADDPLLALNAKDLYGNTPLHYFALRGEGAAAVCAHLEEVGADRRGANHAGETPCVVLRSRCITCKQQHLALGARFCATRLVVNVV